MKNSIIKYIIKGIFILFLITYPHVVLRVFFCYLFLIIAIDISTYIRYINYYNIYIQNKEKIYIAIFSAILIYSSLYFVRSHIFKYIESYPIVIFIFFIICRLYAATIKASIEIIYEEIIK